MVFRILVALTLASPLANSASIEQTPADQQNCANLVTIQIDGWNLGMPPGFHMTNYEYVSGGGSSLLKLTIRSAVDERGIARIVINKAVGGSGLEEYPSIRLLDNHAWDISAGWSVYSVLDVPHESLKVLVLEKGDTRVQFIGTDPEASLHRFIVQMPSIIDCLDSGEE